MANKQKGEVAFGPDHKLVLDWNALCDAEEAIGSKLPTLLQSGDIGVKDMRVIIWAGLQHHHPGMTIKDAGELMGLVGGNKVRSAIVEGIKQAMPSPTSTENADDGTADDEGNA